MKSLEILKGLPSFNRFKLQIILRCIVDVNADASIENMKKSKFSTIDHMLVYQVIIDREQFFAVSPQVLMDFVIKICCVFLFSEYILIG